MKTCLPLLIICLLLAACSTNEKKGGTSSETLIQEDSINSAEESLEEETSSTVNRTLIQKLEGPYFFLKKKVESFYYEDACDFRDFDISITETAEYSEDWELTFEGDTYAIIGINDTKGDIGITTDKSKTFVFRRTGNPRVWGFFVKGNDNIGYAAKKHELENFEIVPCTDMNAIMNNVTSTTWHMLTEIDGIKSVYLPCGDNAGGVTIEDGTIDFWSGSDPFPLVAMNKFMDKVTIVYTSFFDESMRDSIVMHSPGNNLIKFGKGVYEDNYYVTEVTLKEYPEVLERCE